MQARARTAAGNEAAGPDDERWDCTAEQMQHKRKETEDADFADDAATADRRRQTAAKRRNIQQQRRSKRVLQCSLEAV